MMSRSPVDPEEMAKRQDEDLIASLKMIGEGAPHYDSLEKYEEGEETDLPETYQ